MNVGQTVQGLGLFAVAVVGGLVLFKGTKVLNAVNPVNPDNIFAKASDEVAQVITGDESVSLGTAIYDFVNEPQPTTRDSEQAVKTCIALNVSKGVDPEFAADYCKEFY